jgi:hypothetical protein
MGNKQSAHESCYAKKFHTTPEQPPSLRHPRPCVPQSGGWGWTTTPNWQAWPP